MFLKGGKRREGGFLKGDIRENLKGEGREWLLEGRKEEGRECLFEGRKKGVFFFLREKKGSICKKGRSRRGEGKRECF